MPDGSVSIEGVTKRFGDFVAVSNVDLEIRSGEFLTLLGPSGCGKTTLLRMIAGFESPDEGQIVVGGSDVTRMPPEQRPLNMVFQRYALFPHLNVHENVGYGLVTRGVSGADLAARIDDALTMVGMKEQAAKSVKQLSGGQSQRVALARALVNEPAVLLLDEPLGALDLQLRKRMQIHLRSLQHMLKTTFVFVTHDQEEALTMSDRIAVMSNSRIMQLGTSEEIYHQPNSAFVAGFIGESTMIVCDVLERRETSAIVRIDGADGSVEVDAPSDVLRSASDRAMIMIRPENGALCLPDESRVEGVLTDVVFLGGRYRCLIALANGIEAKVDVNERPTAAIGEKIGFGWTERGAKLVATDE